MASAAKSLAQFYNRHYQKRPILTISITNALLAGVSDTLTQKYFGPSQPIKVTATTSTAFTDGHHTSHHDPADAAAATKETVKDKAGRAADQAKQQSQRAKDAVSSNGESMTEQVRAKGDQAKQSLKSGKDTAKEYAETAADHAKTFAQQTSKEVHERGVEGAKDMAEGYGQAAKEMGRIGADKAREMTQGAKEKAGQAADQAKQQTQWTKDSAVSSYGESLTGSAPANNSASEQAHAKGDQVKHKLKGGQETAKEYAETAADHAKTFAQQTSKEVHERGVEGAKDMAEGYGQAAKEMGRIGVDKARELAHDAKDKVPPLVQSAAAAAMNKAKDAASSTDMVKVQEATNQSLEAFAFDYPRLGRFMFYNMAIAPVIHTWYSYIDRTFPLGNATAGPSVAATAAAGGGAMRGVANQAMDAARKAAQAPSLSQSAVPSHQGSTPLPTTRNPTGMSPSQDMAKSAVKKATGAAAAAGSAAGSVAGTAAQSTWLRSTLQPALRRMFADQLLFAPVGLAMLFTGLTVLEGGGVKEVKEKLAESYPTALKANYTIWPIVQLVNFSIMPLQFRLPFVSAVGIVWNAYLSLVNNRGRQAIVVKEQQEQGHLQVSPA